MKTNEKIARKYAESIIRELSRENGFISAAMVGWRESGGYCEPLIRLETEAGTFEAWASDGESIDDLRWEPV